MASRNCRIALLAIIASTALAGCLPELTAPVTHAPAEELPNVAPTISGNPGTAAIAGTAWQFQPGANDVDGDGLGFTATGLPGWTQLNPQTGLVSGVPSENDVGVTSAIVITVSDGQANASLPAFSIIVASAAPQPPPPPPVNTRPSISGSPALAVQATSPYAFMPSAADAETPASSLRFAILNKPVWASFSTTTGALSGTPSMNQAGSYGNIVISVSDGSLSAALPAFTITVTAPPNREPTISGAPSTSATVGTAYSFRPTASDPDGQSLSYAIANKPAWASFNGGTGQLSGTPGDAHVGTTSGIVITVRDSAGAAASLAAFSITVTPPPQTGSAALSWTAPLQYTDGTTLPILGLSGYRIYYGTSASTLDVLAEVDAAATSFTARDLDPGTHYFAVSAVSILDVESSLSAVRSKTIQ